MHKAHLAIAVVAAAAFGASMPAQASPLFAGHSGAREATDFVINAQAGTQATPRRPAARRAQTTTPQRAARPGRAGANTGAGANSGGGANTGGSGGGTALQASPGI
jgi:hypothetical protein